MVFVRIEEQVELDRDPSHNELAQNGEADQRRTIDHPFRWILSAV